MNFYSSFVLLTITHTHTHTKKRRKHLTREEFPVIFCLPCNRQVSELGTLKAVDIVKVKKNTPWLAMSFLTYSKEGCNNSSNGKVNCVCLFLNQQNIRTHTIPLLSSPYFSTMEKKIIDFYFFFHRPTHNRVASWFDNKSDYSANQTQINIYSK